MKNVCCTTLMLVILVLVGQTGAWEFNEDKDTEGWFAGNAITQLEAKDGVMTAHLDAGVNDPYMNGPSGAIEANDVTGLYVRSRWSVDAQGLGGISMYWFNPAPKAAGWDAPEPNVWGTAYIDLANNADWADTVNFIRLDLADGISEARTVEFDWIRYGGLYLDNESFEAWNEEEDRIANWTTIGPEEAFDFNESENVFSLDWAVRGTGTGNYGAIAQPVKGGMALPAGHTVTLSGAVKIPADSWDDSSSLWFRINESDGTAENLSSDIQVSVFDDWFEFESSLTLVYSTEERQSLTIQCYAKLPEGKVFYFDDIFVTAVSEPAFDDSDRFWRFRPTHWEFNTPGEAEGWSNPNPDNITYFSVENLDANYPTEGALLLDLPSGTFDPMINGPAGPYYASKTQGFAARMRFNGAESDLAKPGDGGQHTYYWFPVDGGHGNSPQFEIPAADQWFTAYVDCSARWEGWFNSFRMDFGHYQNLTLVDIDWIRFYGEYIGNNGFEDEALDPWMHEGAGDMGAFAAVSEPAEIVPFGKAMQITGLGTGAYHALRQSIQDGSSIPKGAELTLRGMYYVPSASWVDGSEIWFRLREFTGTPPENLTGSIFNPALDRWTPFEYTLTTMYEPAERADLSVQLYSRTAEGTTIYVDDVFVQVTASEDGPAPDPSWPVNSVRLAEGQTITIDGQVSAAEYDGAQAVVLNDETLSAADPHVEGATHGATKTDGSQPTSLEDYNGTFYFMWDDQYLYAAASIQDDNYSFNGPTPNASDCLQFVLGQTPEEAVTANMYIPTVAPDGGAGTLVAKNDFDGWIMQDVMAQSEIAANLDAATQDWTVEIKIPWSALQLGDATPPAAGDSLGFSLLGIDYDNGELQWFSCTAPMFPWQGGGLQTMTFVE